MAIDTGMLRPLDDLCYLLECAALDCTGELKSGLSNLCAAIEARTAGYGPHAVQRELPELRAALLDYRSDRKGDGASRLGAVSRRWWRVARHPDPA